MNKTISELWTELLLSERAFISSRMAFFNSDENKQIVLRQALKSPSERGTALMVIDLFGNEEKQFFFDELLELATWGHGYIVTVRQIILSIDREFVINRIKEKSESILASRDDEEYRCLFSLFHDIDRDLLEFFVRQPHTDTNPAILKVIQDFQELL